MCSQISRSLITPAMYGDSHQFQGLGGGSFFPREGESVFQPTTMLNSTASQTDLFMGSWCVGELC